MPTINRKQPTRHQPRYHKDNKSAKYYGNKAWKELRNNYFDTHPLCEVCNAHGVVTAAEHVHHRRPFLSGIDDNERMELLLNYNNLMSVCRVCHEALHIKRDRYKMVKVEQLTDKEYNKAHNVLNFND